MSASAPIDPTQILPWIHAALDRSRDLTMTVKSLKTGAHLTYRLRYAKRPPSDVTRARTFMADVLTGPDNGASYTFLGAVVFVDAYGDRSGVRPASIDVLVGERTTRPAAGCKAGDAPDSPIGADAASAKTLVWLFARLAAGQSVGEQAEVWHDGTCARCGRALTRPDSLSIGLGPECAAKGGE